MGKISAKTELTTITGDEFLPGISGSNDRKIKLSTISDWIQTVINPDRIKRTDLGEKTTDFSIGLAASGIDVVKLTVEREYKITLVGYNNIAVVKILEITADEDVTFTWEQYYQATTIIKWVDGVVLENLSAGEIARVFISSEGVDNHTINWVLVEAIDHSGS